MGKIVHGANEEKTGKTDGVSAEDMIGCTCHPTADVGGRPSLKEAPALVGPVCTAGDDAPPDSSM